MPANPSPTETEIVDRVRATLHATEAPVSDRLWGRVSARLDGVAVGTPPPPRLRVAHSSVRRMRRLAAVAAVLLLTLGAGLYLATLQRSGGTLTATEALQRDLDRAALEGPLELDGRVRPLGRDLYEGVAIEDGSLPTGALRACSPC